MLKIIEEFEKVSLGQKLPASAQIFKFLDELVNEAHERGGLIERGLPIHQVEMWYTRIASILTNWIVHPDTVFSPTDLEAICLRKTHFQYIFAASGYRGMGHIVPLSGEKDANEKFVVSNVKLPVILAVLPLDDISDDLMALSMSLLKNEPSLLFLYMMSWLNQRAVLTEQGERNRTLLLASTRLIEDVSVEDKHLGMMSRVYMFCSYASYEGKHEVKSVINKLMVGRMSRAGIQPKPVRYNKLKERPKILVVLERWTKNHAMYRCYAPIISKLKEKFELTALVDEADIDAESSKYFNRVLSFDKRQKTIKEIAEMAESEAPDLVFFPSVGMSTWSIMLSNLRIAPIQIASLGHPATTRSQQIDYVISGNMEGDFEKIFSERVLVGDTVYRFESHPEMPKEVNRKIVRDRVVRIAVNSKVMKLSHRLIEVCKKLKKNAQVSVEFHFFPAERGVYHDGIVFEIKKQIKDAEVHCQMPYTNFLNHLSQCDLSMAAFPFGNTNSTVDAASLGLPTICHFGDEPSSQADKCVVDIAGLPSFLVNRTDDEYYATALKIVHDESFRIAFKKQSGNGEIGNKLFSSNGQSLDAGFTRLVEYVYRNNEMLLDRKVIKIDEAVSDIA
jgi:hypothetical protein